jgi:steroid 5-alpha reductase family enzyme
MIDTYPQIITNLFIFALAGWIISLKSKNVTHVDSMWSLFFVLTYFTALSQVDSFTDRNIAVLLLLVLWALRLTTHLSIRNFGKPEDIRYKNIRGNNEPNFNLKSLYIIFLFQAVLALIVSLPLVASVFSLSPYGNFDKLGLAMVIVGILIEFVADRQLKRFVKSDDKGVLNKGLWRYSRHPNYFGEWLVWLGFYFISVSAGYLITIVSPILMTILLIKISGVGLMEGTITERRPDYKEYIRKTSSFIPWFPRK